MVNNEKGFTLVELMVTMVIFAIFGGMVLMFMNSSSNLFKITHKNYTSRSEARIAMSFVTFKIRQNNISNAIEVVDKENKIKIKDNMGQISCEIFFNNGSLKEVLRGEKQKEIAKIDSFVVSNLNGQEIKIQIGYNDSDGAKFITETITKRCHI